MKKGVKDVKGVKGVESAETILPFSCCHLVLL